MKLFYKSGACSMAAHILLNEAGASYSLEKVDTEKGLTENGGAYADINPRGYVPALQLPDGNILTENVAVLHWLSEQFPTLAAGQGQSLDKFRTLELLSFVSSELHKGFSPYFSGKSFSEERQAENMKKLRAKITQFEKLLAEGSDFLLGDRLTVADAYAFVVLNWANFLSISLADWPKTEAYVARIMARPATQQTLREEGLAA
ncbi:MAG: glutathione binding-like protein [Roseibium sp.]